MIILPICRVLGDLRHKQRVYKKRKDVAQFSRSLLPHLSGRRLKTEYLEKNFKILPISRVRMCICVRDATTLRQNQSCPELKHPMQILFFPIFQRNQLFQPFQTFPCSNNTSQFKDSETNTGSKLKHLHFLSDLGNLT